MELFCEFSVHEYMDEHPRKHVRTFIGESKEDIEGKAREYAKQMTDAYSGGPTTFVKVMNKQEAETHIDELIAYENANPQPDSEEFKQEMLNLLHKCYNS